MKFNRFWRTLKDHYKLKFYVGYGKFKTDESECSCSVINGICIFRFVM